MPHTVANQCPHLQVGLCFGVILKINGQYLKKKKKIKSKEIINICLLRMKCR